MCICGADTKRPGNLRKFLDPPILLVLKVRDRPLMGAWLRMARILIADEDDEVRRMLVVSLVDHGHEIAAVPDGHRACAVLSEDLPDLILLDALLPGRDGFNVLEELNGSGRREGTRVLMLTARGSEQNATRAFELGADGYITKPLDPAELVVQVERMLALSSNELESSRERELDRSRLLSQLESILGDN